MWINYHHLLYFRTIAEEGSVSKAAAKLRIGQPTLSSQLKIFEDHLGVKLFERKNKRLILSEQGKVALDYARHIFKLGSEMIEVLNDRMIPAKSTLHLGALDSIPKQIISKVVQTALSYSQCQITLSEGKTDEMIRELTAHRIDLVVTNFCPVGSDSRGLYFKNLTKNNVVVYGSPKFKNLKKGFPKSLSGQPLVLPTYDSKLRYDLDHWSRNHGVSLNVVVESQDIAVKKLMAIDGVGLIPAAPYAVSSQLQYGQLIEIGTLQGVYEELYFVAAERKLPNMIAGKLMEDFKI